MPSGYTSKLYEGQDQTVSEFILTCARAMGATILQRDEDPSVPPREQEPSTDYYDRSLADARQRLREAESWADDEAERYAREAHEAAIEAWRDSDRKRRELRARYEDMLHQVVGWEPPTANHIGLRDFMIKQLRESIQFDCIEMDPPVAQTGAEHRRSQVDRAKRDIAYASKAREDEVRRTEGRNQWIRALYESLPDPASQVSR